MLLLLLVLGTVSVLVLLFMFWWVTVFLLVSVFVVVLVLILELVFVFVTIGGNLCVGDEMSGKDVNSLSLPQNTRYTNLQFAENQFVKTLASLGDHYEGKQGNLLTSPQIQIQIK